MSARSRARKNKRRNLVPMWDLVLARQTHIWDVYTKKTKKLTGLFPVMFNPRQNGRMYSRNTMLKALGAGPIPVRAYNGEVLKGTIAHPKKVDKCGSVIGNIRIDPNEGPTDEWLSSVLFGQKQGNTCFSMRAIADGDKQPKEITGWNLTTWNDTCSENVDTHLKQLQDWMGVSPEVLNVDPSLLGRKHGEFGGMCVPCEKPHVALAKPTPIEPFKAYDQPIDSSNMTATQLMDIRMKMERANRKILDDVGALQDLLGAKRKPFDEFYLNAPINVYEIFEHHLTILPNGGWLPKPEFGNVNVDQLKVPHKSGPFMLSVVAANEYGEFRQRLEETGFAKIKVTHNPFDLTEADGTLIQQTRYFLITLDGVINQQDPYGFRFDTRPSVFGNEMIRHMLLEGEIHGNQ